MLRYYPQPTVPGLDEPDRYLVTARRKPRGHIEKATEHKHGFVAYSRYHAEYTYHVYYGWRPVGPNGVRGRVFATRRGAAESLVSEHQFTWKGLQNVSGTVQ
jgi:hypothetical protein